MNKKQALEMRTAIHALIRLTDKERYCVAIEERFPETDYKEADYSVHLYVRERTKSGLINLTLLANAIEQLGTHFLAVDSTYDAGTEKGEDIRQSVKIW